MTTRNPDPATIHATRAHTLVKSAALTGAPETLATAHATLALAAEQRTANLIAEATRLQDLLVELPDALRPGDADRIRRILADLGALIGDRLTLTAPEVTP